MSVTTHFTKDIAPSIETRNDINNAENNLANNEVYFNLEEDKEINNENHTSETDEEYVNHEEDNSEYSDEGEYDDDYLIFFLH